MLAITAATFLSFPETCLVALPLFQMAEGTAFRANSLDYYDAAHDTGHTTRCKINARTVQLTLTRMFRTYSDLKPATRLVEGQPPQVAVGIAMGAFRGLFVNILWIRANQLKEDGRYHESMDLARAITQLQPRFPQVWVFHAWNMAYNISVATQTPDERWRWV